MATAAATDITSPEHRLQALSLAIGFATSNYPETPALIETADRFRRYLESGEVPDEAPSEDTNIPLQRAMGTTAFEDAAPTVPVRWHFDKEANRIEPRAEAIERARKNADHYVSVLAEVLRG